MKIVRGKSRHSQTPRSVERVTRDAVNVLRNCVVTNLRRMRSDGLRVVLSVENDISQRDKMQPLESHVGFSLENTSETSLSSSLGYFGFINRIKTRGSY